jgi:hypothetical protein
MRTAFLHLLTTLIVVSFSFGLAPTTQAQDFDADLSFYKPINQTQSFGFSPFYGYRFGGEVEDPDSGAIYDFEDGPAYGLILDYAPENYYGRFEFLWSRQDSRLDFKGNSGLSKVDLTVDEFQLGGVLEFGSQRFREYFSAHIGATHYSSDGYGSDTKLSLGFGGGVKAFLTKSVYLRADLRGFCTVVEAEGGFMYANGITVASFSGSTLWQGQATVGLGVTF